LQALYPLSATLNIIRTLEPSLSPIPNATSFGNAGTAFAQLFYDGVEQFFCQANSCTQNLNTTAAGGAADWQCSNLQCTCRAGATFCGAVSDKNLTSAINGLSGSLSIECGALDSSTNSATCNFKQATLQSLFGFVGLVLNGCTFGECVRQNVIDGGGGNTASAQTQVSKPLSASVIAGLAVVGGLIILSLVFLALGLAAQRAARKSGVEVEKRKASIEWTDLSYIIPGSVSILGKAKGGDSSINHDKAILDSVSGKVLPGQMMAILGPSGELA
jgi:ABC-type multidrug transport system fused ATPase/permease subunit